MEDEPGRREVSFQEAVDFANKFGLAGVIETSSKRDMEGHEEPDIRSDRDFSDPDDENDFCAINDCFSICACKCVDETRR